jgi:hypothetical protein
MNHIKNIFKKSEEFNIISNKLKELMLLEEEVSFENFDSHIFTYSLFHDEKLHEFSFICDDTLLKKERIKELLNLNKITFFEYNIFVKEKDIDGYDKWFAVEWTAFDNLNFN